jgi:RNA recognition motif-containing protein
MTKELYVGGLPFDTTNEDLRVAFGKFGSVTSAQVILDRDTKKSRGFAFVKMESGAAEAIAGMHGQPFQGRPLTVNEARPRVQSRAAE